MAHQEILDFCTEKFRQVDKHFEESIPVREDVINLKKSVEHLQEGYLDIIAKLDKIENKLLNRPPAWVGIAFTVMGSIITGLVVFCVTK